jgi:hypothetical protein
MGITSNASAIARKMAGRPARLRTELNTAAKRIGAKVNATSKGILASQVYSVPIPQKKSAPKSLAGKTTAGKWGLWQRTGNLLRSEGWKVDGSAVILTNNAAYAVPRFTLGLPGHRQPRFTKSVQWQTQAIDQERSFILGARRAAVQRALRG